jgi:hypothetical protein
MRTLNISTQLKTKFSKTVQNQPDRFIDGDNYAGRCYVMSAENKRQQQRIITELSDPRPTLTLSRADLSYLYVVLAQANERAHPYQGRGHYNCMETYYRLDRRSSYWKKVEAFFPGAGIKRIPSYATAWGG